MPSANDEHKDEYAVWRKTLHGSEVYFRFKEEALRMAHRHFDHYSAQGLVYIVRYHHHLKYGPSDNYKVPNNYTKYLARELINEGILPDGFFARQKEDEPVETGQGDLGL